MKLFIPLLFVSLFFLGSCTEEIFIDKWLYDTIYIDKQQAIAPKVIVVTYTIVVRDTVKVEVVIHETDTLFQIITRDSIIVREVEKIVTILDTIIQNKIDTVFVTDTLIVNVYDRTVVYQDTVYLVSGFIRPTTSIPVELIPLVLEYGELSGQYGKGSPRSEIIIQYMEQSELPGEDWNSFSFDFSNQWVIYLNVDVPEEQQRAGIFRELTHLNLIKQYSNDVNKIMSPLFPPSRSITTNDLNILFQ